LFVTISMSAFLFLAAGASDPAPDAAPNPTLSPPPSTAVLTDPAPQDVLVDTAPSAPSADQILFPSGTEVVVRVEEAVSSKTHVAGDFFKISLAEPIIHQHQIIIPAGAQGEGQIVHASKPQFGGKSGELILAARYVVHQDRKVPLRGFQLGAEGGSNQGLANAAAIFAAPLPLVIMGRSAVVPPGTTGIAKLKEPILTDALAQAVPLALDTPIQTAPTEAATPDSTVESIEPSDI
jgi:hypothetical protein